MKPSAALSLFAGLAAASLAYAEPVGALYVTSFAAPSSPRSLVPGGLPGFPDARFTNFNKVFRAPTNGKWATVATTNATPTTADQVFLTGNGLTGEVIIREGSVIPGNSETLSLILNVPRINDAGQWAVAFPS